MKKVLFYFAMILVVVILSTTNTKAQSSGSASTARTGISLDQRDVDFIKGAIFRKG